MKKVFITGINGFTGRYLAAALAATGYEVHGLVHSEEAKPVIEGATLHVGSLADSGRLTTILQDVHPDAVAHLAAIAFVAHGDVDAIYRTNVVGTRNLLEALVKSDKSLDSVLLASSANVYGNLTAGVLDEDTPLKPANDYAVSKLAMEYVAGLYIDRLPIVIARPFNYTGVGQSESFLIPKIVHHVRRHAPVIELGNLDVARDFSDVRVTVEYYVQLLAAKLAGQTFNICSGKAYTLRQVLDMARSISGHDFKVVVNPAFVRANEVRTLTGNPERVISAVGAVEVVPLEETLRWMLTA